MAITPKLDGTGLSQVWAKITEFFVKKEEGKGLSQEDFTTEMKTKLDGVAEGAAANIIEAIKVNGQDVDIEGKVVDITVPTGALSDKDTVSEEELGEELSRKINAKADRTTTLSGYGIEDAYTKDETNEAINVAVSKIYKVKGSIEFANLPVEGMVEGDVYNISDAFTATDVFVTGEVGKEFPAGTNVVYTEFGWDCMAGTYDFSDFVKVDDIVAISEDEINEICIITG